MIHHQNTYSVEKLWQYRQAELNKMTRAGIYLPPVSEDHKQRVSKRRFWHQWFGSRRLGTS